MCIALHAVLLNTPQVHSDYTHGASLTGQTLSQGGESLAKFLGVLFDLVVNGGMRLPFLACCLESLAFYENPAFPEQVPIIFTPTSLGTLLLSMQYKSLTGI